MWTIIDIVAHRLPLVIDCDKILVVDHNEIVAEGTHKYLMCNCSVYKDLYKTEEDNAKTLASINNN